MGKATALAAAVYYRFARLRMRFAEALSGVGERTGLDWLTYNPLILLYYHEQALASAPVVADTLGKVFPSARSFADVGAGSGAFAAELQRRCRDVLAYEHSTFGRWLARRQGVEARPFNLARKQPDPLTVDRCDVAYCFEVAEHLPPALGDQLVHLVVALAETIVFTAAPPGQGGTGHLNEQPAEYWISRFARRGMRRDHELEARVRDGFTGARSRWLAANVLVFVADEPLP